MKFTIYKINAIMMVEIEDLELSIGHSGSNSPAASILKQNYTFFMEGLLSALLTSNPRGYDPDLEFEIPTDWEEYFMKDDKEYDKEYDEFLRLKEKFEKF